MPGLVAVGTKSDSEVYGGFTQMDLYLGCVLLMNICCLCQQIVRPMDRCRLKLAAGITEILVECLSQ